MGARGGCGSAVRLLAGPGHAVPGGALIWFREQRDLGVRYLVENVVQSGGTQLRMYALGAISGLADVAALRGAQLLLGPLLTVLMGIGTVAVPEAVRWLRRSRRHLVKFCLVLGSVESSASLLWGVGLLVLLPMGLGAFVLGKVWEPASVLVLPLCLTVIVGTFTTGATTGLRALGAARRSLRSQVIESTMFVLATVIGASVAGALGATWAGLVVAVLAGVFWWTQFRFAVRDARDLPGARCGGRRVGRGAVRTRIRRPVPGAGATTGGPAESGSGRGGGGRWAWREPVTPRAAPRV